MAGEPGVDLVLQLVWSPVQFEKSAVSDEENSVVFDSHALEIYRTTCTSRR